jgi:hypothetical protein
MHKQSERRGKAKKKERRKERRDINALEPSTISHFHFLSLHSFLSLLLFSSPSLFFLLLSFLFCSFFFLTPSSFSLFV